MTKLLVCAVVLLVCGVAEAQDIYTDCLHKTPDGKTIDICRMPDMRKILSESDEKTKKADESWVWIDKGNGMLATCNDEMTRCWTPCEIKMKEAMREMDEYVQARKGWFAFEPSKRRVPDWQIDSELKREWDSVMKECVK